MYISIRAVRKRWPVIVMTLLIAGLVFYAGYVEPRWVELTHTEIGRYPHSSPVVIAQISDLHLQYVGKLERSLIAKLKEIKPDLVVLSGDVIDKPQSLGKLDEFLVEVVGAHKVAVLGNWEYWSDVDLVQLRATYKRRGIELLVNETARYTVRGRSLVVHGIDDYTAGKPRLPAQDYEFADSSILIQHSPGLFEKNLSELKAVTLCLSGHTHGGQITVFGRPLWTPQGSGRFGAGQYDTATCPLYVSRGIGTSILNFRFGARPEIALFTI